jgi:mannose-6-phosphate isomerase-like protein (cupin superfamily)
MNKTYLWATTQLSNEYDYLAPDGSEIYLLPQVSGGGMAHCTLLTNDISTAGYHKTVDEIWYFISGSGEVWRTMCDQEAVSTVGEGTCLNIPRGISFQFRNTASVPLCFVIATIPRWLGPEEAVHTNGHWSS